MNMNTFHYFIPSLLYSQLAFEAGLFKYVFTEFGLTLYYRGSIPRVRNAPFKNSLLSGMAPLGGLGGAGAPPQIYRAPPSALQFLKNFKRCRHFHNFTSRFLCCIVISVNLNYDSGNGVMLQLCGWWHGSETLSFVFQFRLR